MNEVSRPHATLELNREQLRQLGYSIIDEMVKHYDSLPDQLIGMTKDRPSLEALLREPLPLTPQDPHEVLERAVQDVFGNTIKSQHTRFFAFVPGPSNSVSALADMLAAGFNAFSGSWYESSGPSMVELVTVDWLRQLIGMPETTVGTFTSGGSVANLSAIHVARHHHLGINDQDGVIYYSDQTHSSIDRAVRILGLRNHQVRRLPSDSRYRLSVDMLYGAVTSDKAAGLKPFCVIANAGTTNTGAVDDLEAIADLCQEEGLWMHVDGAYGASAALSERGKALLKGIERADSVTIDPHKWLFQPYEIGCLLVKEGTLLRDAFRLVPEYLKDMDKSDDMVNYWDYGLQLTRGFRALKLWMSFKVFGVEAFRDAVDWGIEQAEFVQQLLEANPRWEIITAAQIGIINFRYVPEGLVTSEFLNTLQQRIVDDLLASEYAVIATTILKKRKVIRLILINPRTTVEEIQATIQRLTQLGEQYSVTLQATVTD